MKFLCVGLSCRTTMRQKLELKLNPISNADFCKLSQQVKKTNCSANYNECLLADEISRVNTNPDDLNFGLENKKLLHCPQNGPYYRDRVIIGTFLAFWVPIYISGSLFSVFWLHSREECQFSLHVYSNELTWFACDEQGKDSKTQVTGIVRKGGGIPPFPLIFLR